MPGLFSFAARTISTSSLVEMWQSVRRVLYLIASSRALMLDLMHAILLRICSCSLNGMSSPYFSRALSRFLRIVSSSSQWTSTGFSLIEKSSAKVFSSSTSIFPVDEPMNTLTPAMSDGFSPVSASPFCTREAIAEAFSLVAPMWKPIFITDFSFASASFSAR